MKLHQAFNIVRGDVVSFIGAGGKTSTLANLGYELADLGWRVLATTTTRIGEDELGLAHHAMRPDAGSEAISRALTKHRFVFLYDSIRNNKIYGLSPDLIPRLLDTIDSDVLLVEADGSRGLPLKAPYSHEPVIPPGTSLVIPVVSFEAVGKPLNEDHVYNPQAIMDRYGFVEGSRIRSPWIAQIIRDEQLGLLGVPENARVMAYFNRSPDSGYGRLRARLTAQLALRQSRLKGVVMGWSPWSNKPVNEVQHPLGAVVLAAGLSTRMGQPKTLLPWAKGKPIIQHIVEQLIRARLDHIVVVTGHMAKEVKAIVKPLGVEVVYNRSYKTGEMLSSLKVGLRAMPDNVAASMVVLGDQPRIQPKVIYQVLLAYAEGKGQIVAPSYRMRRGHPILIGRRYWPELLNVPRGGSPREVINAHNDEIHYVNVDTDSVLRDVDTPEDYSDERRRAGL
jgi:molybdenum cofactor cytidylyltransferase